MQLRPLSIFKVEVLERRRAEELGAPPDGKEFDTLFGKCARDPLQISY